MIKINKVVLCVYSFLFSYKKYLRFVYICPIENAISMKCIMRIAKLQESSSSLPVFVALPAKL